MASGGVTVEVGEDWSEIRESVRRICADYPGEYWRGGEAQAGYATEFVKALPAT
jgi:acyl-CoA dehydrogenase